jgi:hypothetical protein
MASVQLQVKIESGPTLDSAVAVVHAMNSMVSGGDLPARISSSGQGRVAAATVSAVAVTNPVAAINETGGGTTAGTLPPSPPSASPPPGAVPATGAAGTVSGVTADSKIAFAVGGGIAGGILLLCVLAYYWLEYRVDEKDKPMHLRKAGTDRSIDGPDGSPSIPGDSLDARPGFKGNQVVPVFAYPPVASDPPFSRLLLISSRMMSPELLAAAAVKRPGVGVILFDWNTFSLEDLAAACKQATGGGGLANKLDSVGLLTHGKPGNINLVKGRRTDLENLDIFPDLAQFWVELAELVKAPVRDRTTGEELSPGGRVDLLACSVASTAEGAALVAKLEALTSTRFAASDDVKEVGDFLLETDGEDSTVYFERSSSSDEREADGTTCGGVDGIEVGSLGASRRTLPQGLTLHC